MLPLKDNIPTSRFPVVTVALIVICVAVFIWQLNFPTDPKLDQVGFGHIDQSSLDYGAIPYRITHADDRDCAIGAVAASQGQFEAGVVCPGTKDYDQAVAIGQQNPDAQPIPINQAAWWVTLFTSMFMHGGFLHIAGNMLFLWVFGNNIEDRLGRLKFLIFYLLAGLVAVYTQALIDTYPTDPTIGASGAIAGRPRGLRAPLSAGSGPDADLHHLLRHAGRDPGADPARDLVHPPVHSRTGAGRDRTRGRPGSRLLRPRGRLPLRTGRRRESSSWSRDGGDREEQPRLPVY